MKNLLLITVCFFLTGYIYSQTVSDIDGNEYNTIVIGSQTWMMENLKTTRLNDGISIPLVIEIGDWHNFTSPAYCWYNNDSNSYDSIYGKLYNGFTIVSGQLCPAGWYVPTDEDWNTLTDYLGGSMAAGGKLKEVDTIHWESPNEGATNETNFTALPAGDCVPNGTFGNNIGRNGSWWSSTEFGFDKAWCRTVSNFSSNLWREPYSLGYGFSVRCIKDNSTAVVQNFNGDAILVYPNPTTERIFIGNYDHYNINIQIFDLNGKTVHIKQNNSDYVDLSNLQNGIYLLKIESNEFVKMFKFIKE